MDGDPSLETRRELTTEISRREHRPARRSPHLFLKAVFFGTCQGISAEAAAPRGEGSAELGHRAEQALRIGMAGSG